MATQPRVFDAWALMAYLEGEPAGSKVKALLAEAQGVPGALLASAVNMAEVWYSTARTRGWQEADAIVQGLTELGVEVVPADWALARQAAQFKVGHKLSIADCFAAALAKLRDIEVVTGDPEFHELESQVKILWL
ncbi:MAG: type II toxin-antitoxin system VapC family toxin [Planctomycetes bacterium]|nr:type II toxin-antitoxin system VapC family toxin [Planctomycetota bacterium]